MTEDARTWRARAIAAPLVALAAVVIYGAHRRLVYPEWQQYAPVAGTAGSGLRGVLDSYLHTYLGWYRPTSFFLAPYVLRTNYSDAATVWTVNVAFMALVGIALALVTRPTRVAPALLGSLAILGSAVLFYVPYDPQVDSLYILFGIAFCALAAHLQRNLRPRASEQLRCALLSLSPGRARRRARRSGSSHRW